MTPEEAIKELELEGNRLLPVSVSPLHRAVNLGIEALKVVDLARFNSNGEWPPLLPGETPEG